MKYTGFYHDYCDSTFWVKYAIEQDVSDIDHCPSCGHDGMVEKVGVRELDGLIVSKTEVMGNK